MSDLPPIKARVAGVSFENRDGTPRQPYVKQAKAGDVLGLRREPDNPFDPNAIAVEWADQAGDRHQIGYVPRSMALLLAPLADEGAHLAAHVVRKGRARPGPGKPPLYGVRMSIEGDLSAIAAAQRTGLEPALAVAVVQAEEETEGLAPLLGRRERLI